MRAVANEPLARHALAFVLAGGRGSRLMELTDRRAKPAVYFGGKSRIIDFALSNALNSGIRRIAVATQYKAHSLIRHLQMGWNFFRPERNESFDILPASQRVSETMWYVGHGRRGLSEHRHHREPRAKFIVLLAGDHIYKMDYELMLQQHVDRRPMSRSAAWKCRARSRAASASCMSTRMTLSSRSWRSRPIRRRCRASPTCRSPAWASMSSTPNSCSTSCGATPPIRIRAMISARTSSPTSSRTAARWPISSAAPACAPATIQRSYWRDVGTVDAYWAANIDLTDVVPELDLYDRAWPIWTYAEITPPAKFVHDEDGRRGEAVTSLVSGGCIVSGASMRRSLLFTGVHLHSYARVENAVILPYVDVGRGARA